MKKSLFMGITLLMVAIIPPIRMIRRGFSWVDFIFLILFIIIGIWNLIYYFKGKKE